MAHVTASNYMLKPKIHVFYQIFSHIVGVILFQICIFVY